jgi:alpha-L-fucosidase
LKKWESIWKEDPRKANLAWFSQARYGLFLHYGLYSQLGRGEWVQFHEKIRPDEYDKLFKTFSPKGFDADRITDLALEGEMRYINLTTMHHEGFALWKSSKEQWNSWNAARRDLVAELAEACDKKGLGFFAYFTHVLNWRHPYALGQEHLFAGRPHYEGGDPRYLLKDPAEHAKLVDYFEDLMKELLDMPYPLAGLWLDIIKAWYEKPEFIPIERTYAMIRERRPETLISFKQGATGTEDFASPEHSGNSMGDRLRAEGKIEAGERADRAWALNKVKRNEICSTLQEAAWGNKVDAKHKSAEQVWGMLAYADSINCNLLLNTGPLGDGSIHEGDAATIRAVGKRIRADGWPSHAAAVTPESWTVVKKDKAAAAAE